VIAFLRALAPAALAEGPRAQPVFAPRLATASASDSAMAAAATVAPASTGPIASGIARAATDTRSTSAERPASASGPEPTEAGQRPLERSPRTQHPAMPPLVGTAHAGQDAVPDTGKRVHEAAPVVSGPLLLLPPAPPSSPAPASKPESPIATPRPDLERGRTGGSPLHADPAPLGSAASAASATPLADAVVAARVDRAAAAASTRTVVQVSIDRIDIRAPQEPKPSARPTRPGAASPSALGDWLRGAEAGPAARGGRP